MNEESPGEKRKAEASLIKAQIWEEGFRAGMLAANTTSPSLINVAQALASAAAATANASQALAQAVVALVGLTGEKIGETKHLSARGIGESIFVKPPSTFPIEFSEEIFKKPPSTIPASHIGEPFKKPDSTTSSDQSDTSSSPWTSS